MTSVEGTNICHLLKLWSEKKQDKTSFEHIHQNGTVESISFSELYIKALTLAAYLKQSLSPGDRALLLFPPGLDFIVAFMGCLLSGIIAVPAYYPMSRKNTHWKKISRIIDDCEPSLILCNNKIYRQVFDGLTVLSKSTETIFSLDKIDFNTGGINLIAPFDCSGDDVAFLQYSSGSTGSPKGVIVKHENIMANMRIIKSRFGHDDDTRFVCWVPHYHDMGLIGNIIHSIFLGIECTLLSPYHFVSNPIDWLSIISRKKATTSGGPSFAFQLCIDKISDDTLVKANLDLSSWKNAYVGGETIRGKTIRAFTEKFGKYGFSAESVRPVYGLAESTLVSTCGLHGQLPVFIELSSMELQRKSIGSPVINDVGHNFASKTDSILLVSSGGINSGVQVLIEKNMSVCESGVVGNIYLRGDSVCENYWGKKTFERNYFDINGELVEFFYTGDVGFVYDDNLFVTGRAKDLIIVKGVNYYPEDIEEIVQTLDGMIEHGGAAFSVTCDDYEKIVIVQEVDRKFLKCGNVNDAKNKIKSLLSETFFIDPYDIVLCSPSSVPKTTSGKIQRALARDLYLNAEITSL